MKKILKPAEREEAVYYSDFSGKILSEGCPDVELKLYFNYGSKNDGTELKLHLNDEDAEPIINLIKSKLSENTKHALHEEIKKTEKQFEDSMQFRDWDSCDRLSNNTWFLRKLLDIESEY